MHVFILQIFNIYEVDLWCTGTTCIGYLDVMRNFSLLWVLKLLKQPPEWFAAGFLSFLCFDAKEILKCSGNVFD